MSVRSFSTGGPRFPAPNRAPGADVNGHDTRQHVTICRRRFELDVVHAYDLAAVDVDDLLVEEVVFEEQHPV